MVTSDPTTRPWGTDFHHDTRDSRSIFCIDFCTFLINYIIKIIYFFPNISIKKNDRRLYLSKRFCILTLISYLTYFGQKIEFLIFNSVFKIKT